MSNDAQLIQNLKGSQLGSDIQKEIDKEKKMTRLLRRSVEQWNSIVSDLEKGYGNTLTAEEECKTRFMQQKIYNESLQTQITSMKTELRMLKTRRSRFLASVNLNRMANKDVRQHLENLEKELASLKCLRSMYERQLDQESQKYFKAKEERDSIIKDVWFQQQSRIDEQEKIDKAILRKFYGSKPNKISQNRQRPKTGKMRNTGSTQLSGNYQRPDSYQSIHAKYASNDKIPGDEKSVTRVDDQYFTRQTGQRYSESNEIEHALHVRKPERKSSEDNFLPDEDRDNYVTTSDYMPERAIASENFLQRLETSEDFYGKRMGDNEHFLPKIERNISRGSSLPLLKSRENIVRSSQRNIPSGNFLPQIEPRVSREICDTRPTRHIRDGNFQLPEIEREDPYMRHVSRQGRNISNEYISPDIERIDENSSTEIRKEKREKKRVRINETPSTHEYT